MYTRYTQKHIQDIYKVPSGGPAPRPRAGPELAPRAAAWYFVCILYIYPPAPLGATRLRGRGARCRLRVYGVSVLSLRSQSWFQARCIVDSTGQKPGITFSEPYSLSTWTSSKSFKNQPLKPKTKGHPRWLRILNWRDAWVLQHRDASDGLRLGLDNEILCIFWPWFLAKSCNIDAQRLKRLLLN